MPHLANKNTEHKLNFNFNFFSISISYSLFTNPSPQNMNVSRSAETMYRPLVGAAADKAQDFPHLLPIQSERASALTRGFLWQKLWANKKEEFKKLFFNARRLLPSLCEQEVWYERNKSVNRNGYISLLRIKWNLHFII